MNSHFKKTDCAIVVFCIIFLLITAGSVGKRGNELGKRVICASNVRQLTTGVINLANENAGEMPYSDFGFWPWDINATVIDSIIDGMGIKVKPFPLGGDIPVQDVFYCPANLAQNLSRSNYWHFTPTYRIVGYVFLLRADWNDGGSSPILGSGNKQWVSTTFVDNPAETELVIDAILSQTFTYDPSVYPNGNFGLITVGMMGNDSSNHLKTMKEPYGGNIGFVDGHVEWRPFSQMEERLITPGGSPIWWW